MTQAGDAAVAETAAARGSAQDNLGTPDETTGGSAAGTPDGPYRTATARWSLVGLIMTGMVFSLIDRQIISLLVEPIKADLGITDTQFSLLIGPAFVAFYLLFGFPFGWLADRLQRRRVIAVGVAIWSAATVMCGMAWSFFSLAAARAMVGAGEASLTPSSMSIMSDLFPRERLPFVTSVFAVSMHVGGASAMLVGGLVLGVLGDVESISVPLFGALAPWQLAFVIVGLPGFLVSIAFLLSPEAPRRAPAETAAAATSSAGNAAANTTSADLLAFIKANSRAITGQLAAAALLTVMTYAMISWTPAYLIRAHGLGADQAAVVLGLITLMFGPVGAVTGGAASNWLIKRKNREDGPWLAIMASTVGAMVFGLPAFFGPTLAIAAAGLAAVTYFGSLYLGVIHAAMQVITPSRLRGRMAAIMVLCMTGIGASAGPVIVALITDYVFADPQMVGPSIAIAGGIAGVFVLIALGANLSAYRASYRNAET